MKLLLISYDRDKASLIDKEEYDSSQREIAQKARFEKELALKGNGSRYEVVLIETVDEETLRKTHSRYFGSVRSLASRPVTPG